MMAAGLERHHEGGTMRRRPGRSQRQHFRVRASELGVVSLANDLAVPENHRADHRIRVYPPPPAPGEGEGPLHRFELSHGGGIGGSEEGHMSPGR
jgi:hypothetical protein